MGVYIQLNRRGRLHIHSGKLLKVNIFWLNKRKCVLGKHISLFSLFSTSSLRFLLSSRATPSGQDIKVSKDGGKKGSK